LSAPRFGMDDTFAHVRDSIGLAEGAYRRNCVSAHVTVAGARADAGAGRVACAQSVCLQGGRTHWKGPFVANARSWPTTPQGCYNLSGVTDLSSLFEGSQIPAVVDVSLLTSTPRFTNIWGMFQSASMFDGTVTMDTSLVPRTDGMFAGALPSTSPWCGTRQMFGTCNTCLQTPRRSTSRCLGTLQESK
jgi:hypothetical protein